MNKSMILSLALSAATLAGFGGATINLVQADAVEEFKRRLAEEYYAKTQIRTEPWVAQVVDGAQ